MFIDGFMISGYRSFGRIPQKVGYLGKINLLIGKNNSGKSNVLYFLKKHFGDILESAKTGKVPGGKFHELDRHIGDAEEAVIFGFGLSYDSFQVAWKERLERDPKIKVILDKLLNSSAWRDDEDIIWVTYECDMLGKALRLRGELLEKLSGVLDHDEWHLLWRFSQQRSGGNLNDHWIPQTLNAISPINFISVPQIESIPTIRKIGAPREGTMDFSGAGIIDRLARLQNPNATERRLFKSFEKIETFLRKVTENNTCNIEIPYERDEILVHMDGKTLPLKSLGTGVHEVIILAAAATVLENQILCIEEAELHLHPSLQKKLINYLSKETSNQYFITTHSVHLLDVPDIRIFHIKNENGKSIIDVACTSNEKSEICADLGYHASDLLQSNSIIWVEGPSDRIYINYFINRMAPDLIEGVHYSIMFYGGRLLSHLTAADDPLVDDFISLRRLNRNICVVMDSDRSGMRKQINKTKKRIKEEFSQAPGVVWITKGREIENYIDSDIIEKVMKKIYGIGIKLAANGEFDHCTSYRKNKGSRTWKVADKIRIAREIIDLLPNLDRLDLKKKVLELVKFIKHANDV
jgi:AAA15 family ATPase/GTPase